MYRVLNLIPENFVLDYAQNFPKINKTVFDPENTEAIEKMAKDNRDQFKKTGFFNARTNDLKDIYGTSDEEILAGFKAMATDTPTARNDFAIKYNKPKPFKANWKTCKQLIIDSLNNIFSNKVDDSEEIILQFAAALEDCRSSNSSSSSSLNNLIKRIMKREFLYKNNRENPFVNLQVFGIPDSVLDNLIKDTMFSRTVIEEFNNHYKKWNGEPFLLTDNDLKEYIKNLITNAVNYCKKRYQDNLGKNKSKTGLQFLVDASSGVDSEDFIEQIMNLYFAEKMPKLSNFTAEDIKQAKKDKDFITYLKTEAAKALKDLDLSSKETSSSESTEGTEAST